MKDEIIDKLYQVVDILNKNYKQPMDYGSGLLLYYSEVHLLVAIQDNTEANSSELATCLAITNGAVTQVADKLIDKDLIVRFKLQGNNRDTYYRLSDKGKRVYKRHEAHHEKMQSEVKDYLTTLNDKETLIISNFLERTIYGFSQK